MYYSCCRTNQYCRCGRRVRTAGYVARSTSQCYDDPSDNLGQIGIDSSGHLDIGIGGGMAIDLVNGDPVVDIPGTNFGIDLGGW